MKHTARRSIAIFKPASKSWYKKNSNRPQWLLAPGGMSQSNIGIKGNEFITQGLSFIFDVNFGFDPYSFNAANGVLALRDNNGVALANQTSNADLKAAPASFTTR